MFPDRYCIEEFAQIESLNNLCKALDGHEKSSSTSKTLMQKRLLKTIRRLVRINTNLKKSKRDDDNEEDDDDDGKDDVDYIEMISKHEGLAVKIKQLAVSTNQELKLIGEELLVHFKYK